MTSEGSIDYLPWRAPEVEDLREVRPVDAEAARKLAWEQGYSDGYVIGMEAGTRDARSRMGYLHEILEALARPFTELDENVSEQIGTLVRRLAEQLVRREVKLDQSTVCRIVDAGLEALPVATTDVLIIVNPDDAELIKDHLDSEIEAGWRLQTDAKLTRGGCRIISDVSSIDATVESRLDRLVEKMLEEHEGDDADS